LDRRGVLDGRKPLPLCPPLAPQPLPLLALSGAAFSIWGPCDLSNPDDPGAMLLRNMEELRRKQAADPNTATLREQMVQAKKIRLWKSGRTIRCRRRELLIEERHRELAKIQQSRVHPGRRYIDYAADLARHR
jgi:hypothetical protein